MKIVLFDIDGTLIKAGGCGARALDYAVLEMTGVAGACPCRWSRCSVACRILHAA